MPSHSRRLIVNADDFGRSHSINQAIIQAHRDGILTTASLMVNGEAFAEAVELARACPKLGVGLHLTLICGSSTLPPSEIPNLVDSRSGFSSNAVLAGARYFFQPGLNRQIESEVSAQFAKFHATGLSLDHVNGHLHFHLHPTVFSILIQNTKRWNFQRIRVTNDPLALNLSLADGRYFYRFSHALIFGILSRRTARAASVKGLRYTSAVFGLLQNGLVDESFISKLIPRLPEGDVELYSHPSLDQFKNEYDALVSPRIKALIAEHGIQLIRYQDL